MRFGEYVRVSTANQALNATEATQHRQNKYFVEKLGGTIVVEPFKDLGVSGFSVRIAQRDGVKKLLESVRNNELDAIVFYSESRLSRQIIDFYTDLLRPIMKINPDIRFYKSSTMMEWDPNSQEAKQSLIDARRESHNKAVIAKSTQEMMIDDNRRPGARLPVGVAGILGDRLVPDEKLPLVYYIFEMASWGYSEREIARSVQSIDSSLEWSHTTIHHILNNSLYIGQLTWNKRKSKTNSAPKQIGEVSLIGASLPPLVNPSLWNLAHDAIKLRTQFRSFKLDTSFLLSSLLFCGNHECSSALLPRNSTKRDTTGHLKTHNKAGQPLVYYHCQNCGYRIDAIAIHELVRSNLSKDLVREVSSTQIEKMVSTWRKSLNSELERARHDKHRCYLERNHQQNDNSTFSAEVSKELITIVDEVISDLQAQIERYEKLIKELDSLDIPNLCKIVVRRTKNLHSLNKSELRFLILSAIQKITVYHDKSAKSGFYLEIEYNYFPLRSFTEEISSALRENLD